jgi:hypothetical protein
MRLAPLASRLNILWARKPVPSSYLYRENYKNCILLYLNISVVSGVVWLEFRCYVSFSRMRNVFSFHGCYLVSELFLLDFPVEISYSSWQDT